MAASAGVMVAISVTGESPTTMERLLWFSVTPVTGVGGGASASTVMVQVADSSPAEAVMVAVPGATAVTTPLASTLAKLLSLVLQERFLLVAFSGVTVA